MKKVRMGGRCLSVSDALVPRYLAQGYSVIGEDGKVEKEGAITTLDGAMKKIAALKTENRELKERVDELTAALAEKEAVAAPVGEAPAADTAPAQTGYICPVCGKQYKTEKGLTEHIAKEHPQE